MKQLLPITLPGPISMMWTIWSATRLYSQDLAHQGFASRTKFLVRAVAQWLD